MKKTAKKVLRFPLGSKLSKTLGIEILICAGLSILSLFIFFNLSKDVFLKEAISFDSAIIEYIYGFRNPDLNEIMLLITFLGSSLFLFFASSLTAVYLYTKRPKDALIFISIIYAAVIINLFLKLFFQRDRPDNLPLVSELTYSFPSGHAMNSFVFYMAISYFIFRATKNVKLGIIASGILAFLVFIIGVSRIYLGAHYPSDVVAGFIGGFVWLLSAIIFEKTIIYERLYKAEKKRK